MRIAQVSPLYESVPPKLYGGTERIVSYLTEQLVEQGHEVTLFASGDSETSATLVPISAAGLRLNPKIADPIALHVAMVEFVAKLENNFDVIHFHIEYLHFPVSRRADYSHVTTLHGRLDLPEIGVLLREYREIPVVSISDNQRRPVNDYPNWVGTVYHGLPPDKYRLNTTPEGYFAFLGRISPDKGIESAVRIAQRSGRRLKVAAKVDKNDREYYESIRSIFDAPGIEFVGEISDAEKQEFLGNAAALVFPIQWPEPFGIVMIEALACGTPVIAFPNGSVPEILENGKTGFIVGSEEQAVLAADRLYRIDRATCRKEFDLRFTSARMARDYVRIYNKVILASGYRSSGISA
ncbi:MAG: glycosyltransferase family 4 protein [Oligoflexales bacterium]